MAESALNGALEPSASYSPVCGGAVRDPSGNAAPAGGIDGRGRRAPGRARLLHGDRTPTPASIGDRHLLRGAELPRRPGSARPRSPPAATAWRAPAPRRARTLVLNLTESDDPDTGTRAGDRLQRQGGVSCFDANGVEHANRSWPNLTRDAVAPKFVGARTADLNADTGNEIGKVDAVELVYSEEITGTPDVNDFQVDGAAPRERSTSTRQREAAHRRGLGLRHRRHAARLLHARRPEGRRGGPRRHRRRGARRGGTAADGAKPAIVEAETADTEGSPNGTVDHVGMKFSEPVTYIPGLPAIGLTSPDMAATGVAVDGPGGADPRGTEAAGARWRRQAQVTVTDPARVTDAVGNTAPADPFGGTTDNVAPMLVGATPGRGQPAAECGTARGEQPRGLRARHVVGAGRAAAGRSPRCRWHVHRSPGCSPGSRGSPDVDACFTEGSTPTATPRAI